MSVGTIATSILTDIANAIRYQAGVATTYRPSQMAAAVVALDGTYATSFDNSSITSYTSVLYGCNRLVGGTGYVPTSTAGKSNLALGSTGVLTDPGSDSRTWVWAHLYDTGALEITASSAPDSLRTVLATGRICANAHYQAVGATPWYDQRASLRTCEFKADLGSVTLASLDYWFYSNTTLTAVTGWANVSGLASLRYAFNACSGLVTLDLTGLDPSSLADLFYAFAQCTNLTTIYADASWALPAGVSGMGTFYNDTRLVGGNGTAYSSSATGYARMVINRAGQAGYLTGL